MNKKETKNELLFSLKMLLENIESLPQEVMMNSINHYDLASFMLLVYQLHKVDELPEGDENG